jgi:hypothetical protein
MSFLSKLKARTQQLTQDSIDALAELKVPEEVREERYAECQACPHFVHTTTTCMKCGCFMFAKTHLSTASCPIGKWPVFEIKTAPK